MTVSGNISDSARQLLLKRYNILDTAPERDYDDIVRLAASIFDAPVALISFIDQDRIWYKARVGWDHSEVPRHSGMCDHVIATGQDIVVVTDIDTDTRFPSMRDGFHKAGLRFYAGAPLITPDGHAVGTVCVIDKEPRILPPEKAQALAILARQVMALLELRRHVSLLQTANISLAEQSLTDPLTGLPNRQSFDKRLLLEGARAQRTKQNMALLLVNVFGLGEYQTEFGKVAADNAFQTIAKILVGNARPYDYAARFDATIFAVILPGAQRPEALIVAKRLKQAVAATGFPHAPLRLHAGIACVSAESDGPTLLAQASAALQADQTFDERSQFAA